MALLIDTSILVDLERAEATLSGHDLDVLTRNQSEFSRVDGLDVRDLE